MDKQAIEQYHIFPGWRAGRCHEERTHRLTGLKPDSLSSSVKQGPQTKKIVRLIHVSLFKLAL